MIWLMVGVFNSIFLWPCYFSAGFPPIFFFFRLPYIPGTTMHWFILKFYFLHFTNFTCKLLFALAIKCMVLPSPEGAKSWRAPVHLLRLQNWGTLQGTRARQASRAHHFLCFSVSIWLISPALSRRTPAVYENKTHRALTIQTEKKPKKTWTGDHQT